MNEPPANRSWHLWLYDIILIVVLLAGTYLRLIGLNWDSNQHLHPDERFLTMVESALQPMKCAQPALPVEACPEEQKRWLSLSDYFNTKTSTLNPHNRGYAFFVYGTLPIFIVRYAAEWLGQIGYDQVDLVGRQLSTIADLGTILLLYFIVSRLYGRKIGLLAATFSTLAVLQIQQSHFFTVDTFANFFMFLAIYFVVRVGEEVQQWRGDDLTVMQFLRHPLFWLSIGFGLAMGMAMASKINAAPLAALLPAAYLIGLVNNKKTTENSNSTNPDRKVGLVIAYLLVGALAALVAFRIFQPYAFSGPGFFGVKPNPAWIANIREQRGQASGDVDVPFALQWARRSHLYSFTNLTLWGLGLPLGILSWTGFLWMGWRMLKGEWRSHLLIWGWTAFYFLWQSIQFNPTMRYQLPIYPLLAMMAAWLVFELGRSRQKFLKPLAIMIGCVVLLGSLTWAYAFTRIYTRPHTRVAATEWIYQNIPAAINLHIQSRDSIVQQPLPFPYGLTLTAGQSYDTAFVASENGVLTEIQLPHVIVAEMKEEKLPEPKRVATRVTIVRMLAGVPVPPRYWRPDDFPYVKGYHEKIRAANLANLFAPPQAVEPEIIPAVTYQIEKFVNEPSTTPWLLSLTLATEPGMLLETTLAHSYLYQDFSPETGSQYRSFVLQLDRKVNLVQGRTYHLRMETNASSLTMAGTALINESSWDDGLPLRMDGYDGFGGLYQGGLNFEMYWDDNPDKLARFTNTLDQGEYIFMSSNRQWATITRVPERYPLSITFYRHLIGCPPEKDVIWCYNVARPGDFQGDLGYDLVKVFETYPSLSIPGIGSWAINDQFAEEAFTVYDHPKVLIFQKQADYDPTRVQAILGAVDLDHVVHLTPRQASKYPSDGMLPPARLAAQQAGGTWSELFDVNALINRYPFASLVLWYLFIFVLGLFTYPIMRLALPGLADKGYPLARIAGMLLLGYFPWLAGSFNIPYSRLTIGVIFGLIIFFGAILGYFQRQELRGEIKSRWKYFLLIECLFLAFFLIDLLIRLGNPDLWHPAKGGERPMDFSYFNAILKSTSFPPYDPWFAGGYINYYYYGFVLVGTPVKLLGIEPSIAYNLILPTLFAMIGTGAFSIGWNLLSGIKSGKSGEDFDHSISISQPRLIAGFAASAGMVLLGNLGAVRTLYGGLQRIIQPEALSMQVSVFTRLWWGIQGFFKLLTGTDLPFGRGDWYWFPSRVIPAPGDVEPITEFPLFTFLYSDLHAHMIVLPLALLVIAWTVSVVLGRGKWQNSGAAVLGFLLGGLAIGALYPTNLSDIYTYLPLGFAALGYAIWRYAVIDGTRWLPDLQPAVKRLILIILTILVLTALSFWLYEPYRMWYGQGYSKLDWWKGSHTPIWSYLTHWSLFLFVIVSWMIWETREWMAATPISALNRLNRYRFVIEALAAVFLAALFALAFLKIQVGWLVLPLAAWAGLLILRPGMPDAKRMVLFWIGTALLVTLVVEVVVVRGDVGRMNTVFKFYLQAWVFFAVSAAAALGWLLPDIPKWLPNWRSAWQTVGVMLSAGAAMFTILGTMDKVRDRINPGAPHTLDSMTYMASSQYWDAETMDLGQDYNAIRWMQQNVKGSPVIVEGNTVEYRWGSRFTIYTGLPGVVGWNWHQRQQRALTPPNWVTDRVDAIATFYNTTDVETARTFLKKYNVHYIVVGQLEQLYYPGQGLEKFDAYNGTLWREVFHDRQTAIYQVLP